MLNRQSAALQTIVQRSKLSIVSAEESTCFTVLKEKRRVGAYLFLSHLDTPKFVLSNETIGMFHIETYFLIRFKSK